MDNKRAGGQCVTGLPRLTKPGVFSVHSAFRIPKSARILFIALLPCVAWAKGNAKTPSVPKWLDTVPPRVEIMPKKVYHSSVFMITFSANKQARYWVGINSREKLLEYVTPISIARDTAVTVYYYGEDDYGNKSTLDSMRYILDTRLPRLTITPDPGYFQKGVTVRFGTDKPCRFEFLSDPTLASGRPMPESVSVRGVFEGFVAAIDSAGNRTVSNALKYVVDTATFSVAVRPAGGLFRAQPTISFEAPPGVTVYYTFDPLAPQEMFSPYAGSVRLPYGISVLRYYGKNFHGGMSETGQERFILDTIPPRIHINVIDGATADRITLSVKKHGIIRYTLSGKAPDAGSTQYTGEIVIPRKGRALLKALAWDDAGNQSDLLEWERTYDFSPPLVIMTPAGGLFNRTPTVSIAANETCRIFYTLDDSPPDTNSLLCSPQGFTLSREGATVVRYFGIDEAGNVSEVRSAKFMIDTRPPSVKVRIEGTLQQKSFLVRFAADEPARIYYETGGERPTKASPVYRDPIPLRLGQTITYLAVDSAGNMSRTYVMDELKKPMVSAVPEGGMYNHRIHVKFLTNIAGTVYWRMLPDTAFKQYRDSVPIVEEGVYSLEYYLESPDGLKSSVRRGEYFTDWSSPRVSISIRKGLLDSVSVFFECSENATIYYTLDGSNPFFSQQTLTAGNKFTMAKDRISLRRVGDVKLAFFAEDAVGNQSALTILDVFKPRVIPNVPAGPDRLYDRLLSITLNTYDQATIYFCRHGRTPTTDSTAFAAPITLSQSDTIVAFAVDVSGFRGDQDTFIYRIDLPPSARFTTTPDTVLVGVPVIFDASSSVDKETPIARLLFKWDFNGDGIYDTRPSSNTRITYTYLKPGTCQPRLQVIDENKRTGTVSRTLFVRDRCPQGMVSVVDDTGRGFCIDTYEWPNQEGKPPRWGVSWVEATMSCIDEGKRLCTRREWEVVCRGGSKSVYPYGDAYDKTMYSTEGAAPAKAGSFRQRSRNGVFDMVGNVWEWIEDRQGDYPVMMGGSFRDGRDAHCGLGVPSTIAARADDVGFRCCK